MGLALRDTDHHTYADYLTWPESVRYELVNGQAYLMSPAPTLPHQEIVGTVHAQLCSQLAQQPCRPFVAPVDVRLPKLNASVREYWIVHPTDRVLTVYTLGTEGQFGRPDTQLLEGRTALTVLPGISVDWAPIVERLAVYDDDAA